MLRCKPLALLVAGGVVVGVGIPVWGAVAQLDQPAVVHSTTRRFSPSVTAPPTTASPSPTPVPIATTPPTTPAPPLPTSDGLATVPSNFDRSLFIESWTGTIPESSAHEPTGNFRASCAFSHLAYDDPIVYPGQPGQSHLHMFFGNTATDAYSTYESLRTTGDGTCLGGPLNRSAYWFPAVINTHDQVVVPEWTALYYKGPGYDNTRNPGYSGQLVDVENLPNGLRMIAGAGTAASSRHTWKCEDGSNQAKTIPDCGNGLVLVQLSFPQCWDGKNIDSPDHRSHVSYTVRDGGYTGYLACPPSHPVPLPEFTLTVAFRGDADSSNWHVSSDHPHGAAPLPNGSSFHSDWFGAWDNETQATWSDHCINSLRNCVFGEMGDGTRLANGTAYTGPRLLPQPPHPDQPSEISSGSFGNR